MTTRTDIESGLSVQRSPGTAPGWRVVHEGSGLHCGVTLRLKAEAREFRVALLATGCDFAKPCNREAYGTGRHLRDDPHWAEVGAVTAAWKSRDIEPHYDPLGGARMKFCAAYNSDGLIHVTNILAGMTGQHHVHDQPSWEAWRAGIPEEDIIWPSEGPRDPAYDCQCGEPIWQPPSREGTACDE